MPVRITIPIIASGLTASTYLVSAGGFGIRSFPLQKAMDTVQMTINNQSMSINIGDMLSALELYNGSAKLKGIDYSKCATYPCMCQNFVDLALSNRSSLNQFSSSLDQDIPHGGQYTVLATSAISGNASPATNIDFVSTEPLFLSPLYWGDAAGDDSALYGVKTMDFIFNFNSNAANRMIAIDPTSIYTASLAHTRVGCAF